MRQIFLILALFCASFAFHTPYLVLGPNISYGMSGAVAPANARGVFVPQANTSFDFSWLEPLGTDHYGTWKTNKTNYLRFLAGAELSPFYGTVRAGIGVAPLPPPFAILEFRFVYSNENLFMSDVEMPMKSVDKNPSIKEAWNAGYIFDKFYNNSSFSQIQSYDLQLGGKYISKKFDFSFLSHFILIDVTSDYDKKSFDYMRGIPLYSRDNIVAEEFHFAYHFSEAFSWNAEILTMFAGRQFQFYSLFKKEEKEMLGYNLVYTGPSWKLSNGRSHIYTKLGFFTRGNRDSAFSDPLKDRILLSINYKYFWDFKFGKQKN